MKRLAAIVLSFLATTSFATELKVGKTYQVNVDMCVYERVNHAQIANNILFLSPKSKGISEEAEDLLNEQAKLEYEKYVEKIDSLYSKNTEVNNSLLIAIEKAKNNVLKISDEAEKNYKIDILDRLSDMMANKSEKNMDQNCKMIGFGTKFEVLSIPDNEYYVVKIVKYYDYYVFEDGAEIAKDSEVILHSIYYLNKKHGNTGVKVSDFLYNSFSGLTSGPLIIPFKYRIHDKSISGEMTVGYYAGYSFQFAKNVGFTPIISAGVSQIPVAESAGVNSEVKTENRSGVTLAVGFLVSNWDGVNIGLVYGQDRIGDNTWEHEGKSWASFSIGWDL